MYNKVCCYQWLEKRPYFTKRTYNLTFWTLLSKHYVQRDGNISKYGEVILQDKI